MILTEQLRITPGKRHAWYATDLGFAVRKQLGQVLGTVVVPLKPNSKATVAVWRKVPWYVKLWHHLKNLLF